MSWWDLWKGPGMIWPKQLKKFRRKWWVCLHISYWWRTIKYPWPQHGVLAAHIKVVKLMSCDTSEGTCVLYIVTEHFIPHTCTLTEHWWSISHTTAESSMIHLMQLKLEVCGQTKNFLLSSCQEHSCSGICNQLKHFIIEVAQSIMMSATSSTLCVQKIIQLLPDTGKSCDLVRLELVIPYPLLPGSVSVLARGTLSLHNLIHVRELWYTTEGLTWTTNLY